MCLLLIFLYSEKVRLVYSDHFSHRFWRDDKAKAKGEREDDRVSRIPYLEVRVRPRAFKV